jgi:hypothetical protein
LGFSDKKIIFWKTEKTKQWLVPMYSGCSSEEKTLGIPFRTIPRKRKLLRILYRGKKIEANSRDSVPNYSIPVEE